VEPDRAKVGETDGFGRQAAFAPLLFSVFIAVSISKDGTKLLDWDLEPETKITGRLFHLKPEPGRRYL
jgi:hypothetical protein